MIKINTEKNNVVFSHGVATLEEMLMRSTAKRAQGMVTKEGADMSDMYILTSDEEALMESYIEKAVKTIGGAVPLCVTDITLRGNEWEITVSLDASRTDYDKSVLGAADSILLEALEAYCLRLWYEDVSNADLAKQSAATFADRLLQLQNALTDSGLQHTTSLLSPES